MSTEKPLRIGLVIDDFYPSSGGVARSVQTQLSELVRKGHTVTLIAPTHYLDKPLNCDTVVVPSLYIPKTPSHMCSLRSTKKIADTISTTHTFDIIHSQTERGGLILAARIAKMQNIPHVHTFHANLAGTHHEQPLLSVLGSMVYLCIINPIFASISRRRVPGAARVPESSPDATNILTRLDWHSLASIAQRVDAFTAPADFMIRRITDCSSTLSDRGHVIPTGINRSLSDILAKTAGTAAQDSTLRLLSVCRLSREKRVDVIIKAFIKAGIPNSRLDIVGSGDQEKHLRNLAEGKANIKFHRHVEKISDLARLYTSSNAFILASYRFDTQAITIAEAVSAGLPVIYCDDRLHVGVNSSNSILAASPDAEALSIAIQSLSDKSTRRKASEASLCMAPGLRPDSMANTYISLYQSVAHH